MKARKGNKIYNIVDAEKDFYLKQGFDILDDKGNITDHAPGKSVSFEEYQKLKEKAAKLEKEIKELKKGAQ